MADATYGGMATSAFPVSPASLLTGMKVQRWRPKPGRDPKIEYIPQKASEIVRRYDILNRTGVTVGYERAIDPVGTADTATLSGDITDATAPLYMAMGTKTASSSVDDQSKIPAYRLDDIQVLARLYHSTPGSAEIQDVNFGSWRYEATTLYEWGIYEPDTTSAHYYLIVDVANQDDDDGVLRIVEPATESGVADDFGLVWVEFEVSNLA